MNLIIKKDCKLTQLLPSSCLQSRRDMLYTHPIYAEQEHEPPEPHPPPQDEPEAKNGLLTGTFTASETVFPINRLISSSKS